MLALLCHSKRSSHLAVIVAQEPYVMATFPLARYMEALGLVRDHKVIGKVVLTLTTEN